jgi:hypothetical protein
MVLRGGLALAAVAALVGFSLPAGAQEMNPDQARRFVVGKTFAYQCFDGTRGAGRIMADGSVAGNMQSGSSPGRYMVLPANTVHESGGKVCATVRGIPFRPCFNLTRMSERSFRGAISGLGFAYCDFTRSGPSRRNMIRSASASAATAASSTETTATGAEAGPKPVSRMGRPMALRSSLAQ